MSRNNELCLKRLVIGYNTTRGHAGIRQALAREIPLFSDKYPTVKIELRPRRQDQNFIAGVYRDGSEKCFDISNMSAQGIWHRIHRLVSTANDNSEYFSARTMHHTTRSVGGAWNPWLWTAERHVPRVGGTEWDRKLSDSEWNYYVDKYSDKMRKDEKDTQAIVDEHGALPKKYAEEVAERWKKNVTPHLQTDIEVNLAALKKAALVEKYPAPPSLDEYELFSVPSLTDASQDTINAIRRVERSRQTRWWQKRREQLKPPK